MKINWLVAILWVAIVLVVALVSLDVIPALTTWGVLLLFVGVVQAVDR